MSALQAPMHQEFYTVNEWNNYAHLFAYVTPSIQLAIYQEASLHLTDSVVDCGSGTAKIASLLVDNPAITSYTGVDYSEEMIAVANWILRKLKRPNFQVLHQRIEDLVGQQYASAVSIQSYYAWPNPEQTLAVIFQILKPEGKFVLASPNETLPLKLNELANDLSKELIAHPYLDAYLDYNLKLAQNTQAHFVEMDELVKQVQAVGFHVEECHQRHLRGGLNFLVLRKKT